MSELVSSLSRVACIIYLSPRPRSAPPPRCLDEIAGVPLIVRTLERLRAGLPGLGMLTVVGHDPESPVKHVVESASTAFFAAGPGGMLEGLREWSACHAQIDVVAVLPDAAVFPDCVTAGRLVDLLRDAQADAAVVPDSVVGLIPLVLATSALPTLAALFQPGAPLHGQDDGYERVYAYAMSARLSSLLRVARLEEPDAALARAELPRASVVGDRHTRIAAERVVRESDSRSHDASDARALRRMLDDVLDEPVGIRGARRPRTRARSRILFTSCLSMFTGADQCLLSLIDGLDGERFDPVLVVQRTGLLADRAGASGIIVEVADFDSSPSTPVNLRYWSELLAAYEIDLVHVDTHPNDALMITAFQRGLPVVGYARFVLRSPLPPSAHCASVMIAPSERIAASLRAAGCSARKVRRIYDGVDRAWFSPAAIRRTEARARLGVPSTTFVVCMVTRITRDKAQDVAVRAVRELLDAGIDATLLLVGDVQWGAASYEAELRNLGDELGVAAHVRYLGFLPDPRPAYAAADAVVVCMDGEGLGQSVLEGIAMGVPAVVPRGTLGPGEIIRDGAEGLHYAAGDSQDLGRRLAELRQPDAWMRMAEAALQRSAAFDLRQQIAGITQVYEDLLRQPAGVASF